MLRLRKETARTLISVFFAIALLASCEKYTFRPPEVDPEYPWSIRHDIQPLFTASCATCHGGSLAPDLRAGNAYNSLTRGGYVSLPADNSRLYKKMIAPDHTARSTEAEKLKVLYWITQGAKNN